MSATTRRRSGRIASQPETSLAEATYTDEEDSSREPGSNERARQDRGDATDEDEEESEDDEFRLKGNKPVAPLPRGARPTRSASTASSSRDAGAGGGGGGTAKLTNGGPSSSPPTKRPRGRPPKKKKARIDDGEEEELEAELGAVPREPPQQEEEKPVVVPPPPSAAAAEKGKSKAPTALALTSPIVRQLNPTPLYTRQPLQTQHPHPGGALASAPAPVYAWQPQQQQGMIPLPLGVGVGQFEHIEHYPAPPISADGSGSGHGQGGMIGVGGVQGMHGQGLIPPPQTGLAMLYREVGVILRVDQKEGERMVNYLTGLLDHQAASFDRSRPPEGQGPKGREALEDIARTICETLPPVKRVFLGTGEGKFGQGWENVGVWLVTKAFDVWMSSSYHPGPSHPPPPQQPAFPHPHPLPNPVHTPQAPPPALL